jgi:hypothetical protein
MLSCRIAMVGVFEMKLKISRLYIRFKKKALLRTLLKNELKAVWHSCVSELKGTGHFCNEGP